MRKAEQHWVDGRSSLLRFCMSIVFSTSDTVVDGRYDWTVDTEQEPGSVRG
jgi:hypothetical protein